MYMCYRSHDEVGRKPTLNGVEKGCNNTERKPIDSSDPTPKPSFEMFESLKFLQRKLFRSLEDWKVSSLQFLQRFAKDTQQLSYNTSSLDDRKYSSLALEDQSLDHLETKLYDLMIKGKKGKYKLI
ncbi:hypothetical protein Tco_0650465 [Tanacetum coccineum]